MPTTHPLRVRLYGGRLTHAARETERGDYTTACGQWLASNALNHRMPDSSTITCRRCETALARRGAR